MCVVKYRRLGSSELRVSSICLGTMTFGQQNTQEEAHRQLDYAFDQGVNFVDVAEMYPVPARADTQGRSEAFLGEWLKKGPRSRAVVATKIAGPGRPFPWLRDGSLSIDRTNVRLAVEASLKRLKTDYIDLYQIHWPDRYVPQFGATSYDPDQERTSVPVDEQLRAFAEIVSEGKVRYIGLSNETPWGVAEFSRTAQHLQLPKVVSIQNAYNLLNRVFDGHLAEASRREDVPLLAYSPLAFGILTGKYLAGPPPGSRLSLFENFGQRYRNPQVDAAAPAYFKIAAKYGLSPAQLALAFVQSRWFTASTIIGATTLSQLEENIRSVDVKLDPAILAEIDAVHARHPNPAP